MHNILQVLHVQLHFSGWK